MDSGNRSELYCQYLLLAKAIKYPFPSYQTKQTDRKTEGLINKVNNSHHLFSFSRHQEISTEWRRDCAVLSSRWHWLQQRIADLEQAIRRQTEVCESLKAVKQPFRHEQITEPTPKPQEQQMNNCSLFLFVPSESRLSTDLRPTNGLLLKLSEASKTTNEACHAARTCPLINRPYRRLVHMCTDEVRERGTGEREEVGCYDPAFHHKLSVNTGMCRDNR